MKYTLLEMVQAILGSMDSDEVDNYDDTVESLEVARIIKESYYEIVRRLELPVNHTFFQLTASGDNTKPTLMYIPSDVVDLDYIKYNKPDSNSDPQWYDVHFMELREFIEMTLNDRPNDSNVSTMTVSADGTNFTMNFKTDRYPSFYTLLEEDQVLFDAHLSTVDDTLRASKTMCFGKKMPTFTMANAFTPQLENEQFGLLLNEAKVQAFYELKQMENKHAADRRKKNWQHTQKKKYNLPNRIPRAPGYGRRPA